MYLGSFLTASALSALVKSEGISSFDCQPAGLAIHDELAFLVSSV